MAIASYLLYFVLFFFVAIIALQLFLSLRAARWPGLLIPALCFLFSLVLTLSAIGWQAAVAVLLLGNIPTLIHLAIYAACRSHRNRQDRAQREMDRMRAQDLD